MARNDLINVRIDLQKDMSEEQMRDTLHKMLHRFTYIYSYIIYNKDNAYRVVALVSQTLPYNTLHVDNVVDNVIDFICNEHDPTLQLSQNVIGYEQPPLEILLETYKPLIYKLSLQQYHMWPQVELEDLIQMCNLRICVLYQQGYYIHKNLLSRSFANAVLMFLRPEKYKPQTVSLDEISKGKDEETAVNIAETIEDEHANEEMNEVLDEVDGITFEDLVNQECKQIVLEFISSRTYDQWMIEYNTKTVSRQTASQVNALKSKLKMLGISRKNIADYLIKRR